MSIQDVRHNPMSFGTRPVAGAPNHHVFQPYQLPPLPYPIGALEPHIQAEALHVHYDMHHNAYVAGANRALAALDRARASGDFTDINQLESDLAFHVSGHVLHSIFWHNLSPSGGGRPTDLLAGMIDSSFGSFDAMRIQFTRAALALQGSGWAVLGWEPLAQRLVVHQLHDHRSGAIQGSLPLLVCDVWEHAYYLQYRHDRAAWLDAFWEIVDWNDVTNRMLAGIGRPPRNLASIDLRSTRARVVDATG